MNFLARLYVKVIALALLSCVAVIAQAQSCTDVWKTTSAAATCILTVNPIPESVPSRTADKQGLPFQNCEIHASCLTGKSIPIDPTNMKSVMNAEYKQNDITVYIDYLSGLKNCSGRLQQMCQ
jgi:hypothetical protein